MGNLIEIEGKNCTLAGLTLEQLAGELGLEPSELIRMRQQEWGPLANSVVEWRAYLNQRKIEKGTVPLHKLARLVDVWARSGQAGFTTAKREAVENIGEIVKVPGIDAVLIGPYDLAASMGKMGQVG